MGNIICCIPVDKGGNSLFIKDFRAEGRRCFIKYKSTYNDMPFMEIELFYADNGENFTINGDDGTVLYRFSVLWIKKLMQD